MAHLGTPPNFSVSWAYINPTVAGAGGSLGMTGISASGIGTVQFSYVTASPAAGYGYILPCFSVPGECDKIDVDLTARTATFNGSEWCLGRDRSDRRHRDVVLAIGTGLRERNTSMGSELLCPHWFDFIR